MFFCPLDEFDVAAPKKGEDPIGVHSALQLWKDVRRRVSNAIRNRHSTPTSVPQTVNSDLIPEDIPIVLLFNKVDLLTSKLERKKFSSTFAKFKGNNEPSAVIDFLKTTALGSIKDDKRKKSVFVFSTSAIDAESVKSAWAAARQQAVTNSIADTGL